MALLMDGLDRAGVFVFLPGGLFVAGPRGCVHGQHACTHRRGREHSRGSNRTGSDDARYTVTDFSEGHSMHWSVRESHRFDRRMRVHACVRSQIRGWLERRWNNRIGRATGGARMHVTLVCPPDPK